MSVDQIRAALDTIDATPRDEFLRQLEEQLVAAWVDDVELEASDVLIGVGEVAPETRHPGQRWMLVAAATIVVLALGLLAVAAVEEPDSVQTDTVPPAPAPSTMPATTSPSSPLSSSLDTRPATTTVAEEPLSAFSGRWTSTDTDGSAQTMEIGIAGDGSARMRLHDDVASVACSGAAATVTGTGELNPGGDLVITIFALTCDDGSEPATSGDDLDAYTLAHDGESDTLTDNLGVVWRREGAEEPSAGPPTSGGMWPQSSVDEITDAQALADAGDPAYTWQVDPQLSSDEWWSRLRQPGAEIAERFLREELGWDEFLFNTYAENGAADGVIRGVVYLRCAPGGTNRLYPVAGQGDAIGAHRCAPTIDDLDYETVSLDLAQLDRRGPDGIWVVRRWATSAPFSQRDPRIVEAEATARLEDFLRARIDGAGAEGFVDVVAFESPGMTEEVPLLYATTTGAPYERFELERVSEPQWPYGDMGFSVRLFADGGETVVEQQISVRSGSLVHHATQTTENGQPVAAPYVFFDGEVKVLAADPWNLSPFFESALAFDDQSGDERVELVRSPLPVATGCAQGSAPADADALARSIRSDPDLVATGPVRVSIGGAEGLAMDVTVARGASVCETFPSTLVLTQGPGYSGPRTPGVDLDRGSRMRLYLLDLPEGSTTPILAIAVVAPEARFDDVIDAAAPIIESIELETD